MLSPEQLSSCGAAISCFLTQPCQIETTNRRKQCTHTLSPADTRKQLHRLLAARTPVLQGTSPEHKPTPLRECWEVSRQHGTARHGASLPQLARSQSHPWIMCNCAPFCSLSLYIRVASPSQQHVFLLPFFLQKVKEAFGARLQSLLPRAGRAHGRYKTSFHVRS